MPTGRCINTIGQTVKRTLQNLVYCICLLALAYGWSVVARRGYMTPEVGVALNWACPPEDLYYPLASGGISKGNRNYEFLVSHKYVGRHGLQISIARTKTTLTVTDNRFNFTKEITVTLEIEQEGKQLLRKSERSGRQFWGRDRQGSEFCVYKFPSEIAVRGPVLCRVVLDGDIDSLFNQSSAPIIEIRKLSDE